MTRNRKADLQRKLALAPVADWLRNPAVQAAESPSLT